MRASHSIARPGSPRELRWRLARLAALLFFVVLARPAFAADDDTLEILKNKGIVTQEEYDRIRAREKMQRESDREELKFRAAEAAKEATQATARDEVRGNARSGFTFESADKSSSIGLRGVIQLDYRTFGGPDAANADTFDVRRAYLGIEGKLYENYEYRIRANFSTLNGPTTTVCTQVGVTSATDPTPRCTQTAAVANTSNTSLDEAWINLNWWTFAQLKLDAV
jgi:Phosphate-selective porin O and P